MFAYACLSVYVCMYACMTVSIRLLNTYREGQADWRSCIITEEWTRERN